AGGLATRALRNVRRPSPPLRGGEGKEKVSAFVAEKFVAARAPPTALRIADALRRRALKYGGRRPPMPLPLSRGGMQIASRAWDSVGHLSPVGRGREPTGPARSRRPDDRLRERVRGFGSLISISVTPSPQPSPHRGEG